MLKRLLLAAVFTAGTAGIAFAVPISGSFSLSSFNGSFVGGSSTALTATGLDFGTDFASGGGGNGYGTNGTAQVGNGTGSFVGLSGSFVSIADISLDTFANPFNTNPFISFTNGLALNFTNASYTRSPLGTSVSISGDATFTDGNPDDTSIGRFNLSTASQNGMSSDVQFTFTSNASVTSVPVPEPASLALLGVPMVAAGLIRRRRNARSV